MTIDFAKLAEPFAASEIDWRVGNKTKKGDKATLLPYLNARAVMKRLDEVVGPAGWRDSYVAVNAKQIGFVCTLELEVSPGVWVGKADAADVTDIESIKGGVSDALKRAAVKWGIGRYLYDLPEARYLPIREGYPPNDDTAVNCPIGDAKSPGHILIPKLPAWALPPADDGKAAPKPEQKREAAPKAADPAPAPAKEAPAKPSDEPKPQASANNAPAGATTGKQTRAERLLARCVTVEKAIGPAKVQDVRRKLKVAAGDLAGLDLNEDQLVAYGTALGAAAASAGKAAA